MRRGGLRITTSGALVLETGGVIDLAEVMTKLYKGDCLDLLGSITDESIDMILCDLPYGTTRAPWDKVIAPVLLWKQYRRIIKPHGCIALFSMLPFAIDLITPARDLYRYEWTWKKTMPVGFLNANRMPLRIHESILIFYKALPKYNPIKWQSTPYGKTVSGDTVLDNAMGTGGTGIAAARLDRKFIGIEKDEEFFHTALSRIVDEVGAVKCSCDYARTVADL